MASTEARVYFSLAGYYFNPTDLTPLFEIEPTSVYGGGLPTQTDKPIIGLWELSTDKSTDDDINIFKMTRSLVDQLSPITEHIQGVIKRYNLIPKIGVVVRTSAENDMPIPEFGFESSTIKFMAEIGAFVEIDSKNH